MSACRCAPVGTTSILQTVALENGSTPVPFADIATSSLVALVDDAGAAVSNVPATFAAGPADGLINVTFDTTLITSPGSYTAYLEFTLADGETARQLVCFCLADQSGLRAYAC